MGPFVIPDIVVNDNNASPVREVVLVPIVYLDLESPYALLS